MADELKDASSAIGVSTGIAERLCGGFKTSDEAIEKK